MAKRNGLSVAHGLLVNEFILKPQRRFPQTANSVRDGLWDAWGKNTPTCREIGMYLMLSPLVVRTEKKYGPAEYILRDA
mgnify:FL=1|jgi:hypothetical protein